MWKKHNCWKLQVNDTSLDLQTSFSYLFKFLCQVGSVNYQHKGKENKKKKVSII